MEKENENPAVKNKQLSAMMGRQLWLELKNKYHMDDDWCLIVLPSLDQSLNEPAVSFLGDYLERKFLKYALVVALAECGEDLKAYGEISKENAFNGMLKENIYFQFLKEKKLENLLDYYRLQQFFKNIVVVSTGEPFGSPGIIGKCGLDAVDYVKDALYV